MDVVEQRAGFTPYPFEVDWTDKYDGSVSKLRQDLESGIAILPSEGVVLRSDRISKAKGFDVYFRFKPLEIGSRSTSRRRIFVKRLDQDFKTKSEITSRDGEPDFPDWTNKFLGLNTIT